MSVKTETQMRSGTGSNALRWKRLVRWAVCAALLVWLLTGGIAIERTQSYESESLFDARKEESLYISIHGNARQFNMPLVFSKYYYDDDLRVFVTYHDFAESSYDVLEINSLVLTHENILPMEMITPGSPVKSFFCERVMHTSSSIGVSTKTFHEVTFNIPLIDAHMPFVDDVPVHVRIRATLSKRAQIVDVDVSTRLSYRKVSITRCYWYYWLDL
jgi:hypothetical protein